MKQLLIKQQKNSSGFGKPTLVEYEGVEFSNGKIAFLDDSEAVNVYDKRSSVVKALEKNGKVEIEENVRASDTPTTPAHC